jgi:glycosyltransferase involved in cell wall biosynthesis
MKHILLTTDVVGGVWDFALALARELIARGALRITVLALGEPSDMQTEQARESGSQLIAAPLKLEWMQTCQEDVQRTRKLIDRLVRDLRPDVVHANQFVAACTSADVPVVLTLHSDVLSWRRWTLGRSVTPPEWLAYAALVREALDRADRIVAVSQFLAEETRAIYGCRREITVIHNGWPPGAAPGPARRTRTTLVAGRAWDAAKNIGLVADAARGWSPGPISLAGQQTSPESGAPFESPSPLEPLGYLSRTELEAVLRSTRVYLSPARYDPFGLLPLQAALSGCALLLSDIPSYRELWEGAAVFFHSNDPADLRKQWSRLLDQPDVAVDLAARAHRRALARYSAVRMAEAYNRTYDAASLTQRAVAV